MRAPKGAFQRLQVHCLNTLIVRKLARGPCSVSSDRQKRCTTAFARRSANFCLSQLTKTGVFDELTDYELVKTVHLDPTKFSVAVRADL